LIQFACSCGNRLKAPDESAGKPMQCPSCGQEAIVPAAVPAGPIDDQTAALSRLLSPEASGERPDTATCDLNATIDQPGRAAREGSPQDSPLTTHHTPRSTEGPRLGGYRILRELGQGGMGVVYEAEDVKLERRVSLKVMKPELARDPRHRERFLREACTAASVQSPFICPIYEVGEEDGIPYIAMPFLPGEPLAAQWKKNQRLPLDEVVRIGKEVAEGLSAAHEVGLVHRDIKPSNIWLETQPSGPPRAIILDFGLARVQADNVHITQSGVIVGTPAYMSPEQARGDKNVDARTDLFSLGCVLYALCTGELPFKGKQMMEVLLALATQEPTPPHTIAATVPQPMSELILRLLAKDPDDRPGTAHAVIDALTAIERDFVTPAPGTASTRIKRAARTGRTARPIAQAAEPTEVLSPSAVRGAAARKRSNAVYTLIGVGLLGCVIALVGGVYYVGKDKETIEVPKLVKPVVPAGKEGPEGPAGPEAARGDGRFTDDDVRRIAALPAAQQVEEVRSELVKRNPGFDGKLTPEFADNAVKGLKFATDHIVDISPVRALTRLQSLDMQGVNKASLVDLSPLKGMALTALYLDFNPVQDLSPLQGMRLKELDLHGTRVQDLTPLKGMPLEKLMLWAWPGTDLTPLKGMASLKWLNCGGNGRLRDLSPLAGSSLEYLCVNLTEVSDLGPLKGVPLKQLQCSGCRVGDLTPLRGMRLEELYLPSCKVWDLAPLEGLPLHTLDLRGNPVNSLLPLRNLPLKKLVCEFQAKRDAQFLLPIKTLATINEMPADQFFREVVFAPRLAPMLRGEDKPADDVERLAFAKYAADQKKYRFAVQLWAEALANSSKLGDTILGDDRFFLPKAGDNSFMASDRDGKWLAVPIADSVVLFDAGTGELVRTLTGSDRMFALAISPDGKSVAGGNWVKDPQKTSSLKVWNLQTGQETLSINSGVGNLWAVRFDADGTRLFGSGPGGVQIWDLSGKLIRTFKASGTNAGLFQIAISPDGKRVVSNDTPTTYKVWEIEGDRPPVTLAGRSQPRYRMSSAYSPNGKLLATGSDQDLLLFDAEKLELVKKINTSAGWFAFAPDSQSILTARHSAGPTATDVVTRWDLATYEGKALPRLSQGTGWFLYHLSPDGKSLYALVNGERRLRVYDAATGNALFPPQRLTDPVSSVAFSPGEASVRYHAARAALLAAAEKGEDQPPLYNLGKAKLRRQALDWLKAELAVWTGLFKPGAGRAEHVWIDDDIPPGAVSYVQSASRSGPNEPWTWVTQPQHPVLSGRRAVKVEGDGLSQCFFSDAPAGLRVGADGRLFAYVYLDPARPPKEIMLHWNAGDWDWEHRAYWGDNLIDWGRDGSAARLRMGPLPEVGKWVRLEVEAARVGIDPTMVIRGWSFSQHGGTTYWDRAGIVTDSGPGSPRDVLAALSAWRLDPGLAGVRDAAALARLPADERNEWQALWARVPDVRPVVPTSKQVGQKWRYTTQDPAEGWQKADFDDKSWQEGVGSFGGYGKVGTTWKTDDIWLRREFTLPEGMSDNLLVLVNQDDDAEVYVNGVLAYERKGWSAGEYLVAPLSEAARAALQPGKNVLAVHGHNVVEGQYIDAGIVAVQNNAGRLLYAQIALDRKQFALAADLWARALASDPKLGDDRQARLRYHAARAAALALAGQGTGAPQDDATKATLVRQALDLLKAEVAATTDKQSRLAKVETLWQWQQDSDFAGIREPAELAKLPADEQKACSQLWADLAKMEEPANDAERKEFAKAAGERLMDADAKQFGFYFAKLNAWRQQGLAILTGEIDRKPLPPAHPDWTVRFYKCEKFDNGVPSDWNAVLKSPILDELNMPRLHLVELTEPPRPPTPKVPGEYFAVVATTEVTLEGGEYVIRATSDDGVRVWLDNKMVLDDWSIHAPTTRSVSVRNKRGKHLIKVEFFQATRWYHLEVDVILAEERLAQRQANAAVALLRLNQPAKVWPLLKQSPDPRVRSYLIDRLAPLGADAGAILKQLDKESDLGILRALLLSLGEFPEKDLTPEERKTLLPKLQDMYRTAADAGVHAAAESLLRQWKEDAWLKETNQAWAGDKQQQVKRLEQTMLALPKEPDHSPRWYVNGQGQTLVVMGGPVAFWMGSPSTEEGRDWDPKWELRHWRRIGRSFAIASKEVTVEQFLRFRKDHPISRQHAPSDDCPVNMVTWYEAAEYCNWLSEQEGIPRDQWCYEPNAQGQYAQGMKMAASYLQRTGYRLPTEAEWEFACRAGTVTRFSFGESDELLPRYAWYLKNGNGRSWPVGSLRPNDLGLFDMHGNDWEWSQDAVKPYGTIGNGKAIEDIEATEEITDSNKRVLRGGALWDVVSSLRSASRYIWVESVFRGGNTGFRPVRTLPFSTFDRYAAARAAALAAAGQGKDQPPLDDAAKAKLRQQALDWLKAELAAWIKVQPPRVFIARNVWQWQHDRDLASIRDHEALTKVPVKERKVFAEFWADVAKTAVPQSSAERLDFARAAVLIVAGKGKDEPFDDTAKAKLREQALAWLQAELTAATFPASKAAIIAAAAPLKGALEKLAESVPDDGQYQAELARHFAERGDRNLADAARNKARALFEARLAREPANAALAADLADVLIDPRWIALKPVTMKTAAGATLTLEQDGSIFVSGNLQSKETYTLEFHNVPRKIRAIRLEALRDDRLPGGGPGTNPGGGNFVLSHLAVLRPDEKDPAAMRPIALRAVFATFEEAKYRGAESSLTNKGDPNSGWSVHPELGKSHHAIFAIDPDLAGDDTGRLTMVLDFYHSAPAFLGRFRVSVSADDPDAIVREQGKQPAALTELTDPWVRLAAAYALDGRNDKALQYFGTAIQRADGHAGKATVIGAAAPLRGLLEELAESIPNDGLFQAELARHFAQRGDNPLADAACARARALFEAALAREPANSTAAADLADVLLIQGRATMERSLRLGRQNQGNGLELVDYPLDGGHESAEIDGQPCRRIETGQRGWGHAYFAIDKGFKWAPNMHVQLEVDYWADRAGWFTIQYDSHDEAYNKSLASVHFAGSEGWKTARFELKEARFASSQNGGADFRVVVAIPGRFCLKRVSMKRLISGPGADDPWAKLVTAYAVIGRNDRAVECLGRALQADPKLAGDRAAQRRYYAARAAVLAGAGQGRIEPPLDDAAKAKLRRQAFDWLNAELTVWSKLFETGPQERANIVATLSAWQQDADLAGIRDAAALAKLPADERNEWQALWTRVPDVRPVLPTSREVGQGWRYTTTQPAEGWQKADFDDKQWQEGVGAFGSGWGVARTEWKTDDIWLRHEFTLADGKWDDVLLRINHDDGAEVYINGVLALKAPAWSGQYVELPLSAEARATLQPGKNVIAVHCHNDLGPQWIDVGMVVVNNNAARLALAQVAYDLKHFATAAELWARALASDSKLGADRRVQHGYQAAHSAALALAGQSFGEAPLDNAAKAHLRRLALESLKAALTDCRDLDARDPAQHRSATLEALSLWRKDNDLAGIRDAEALAQLPAGEQEAFAQLWAEVAALLGKNADEALARRPDDVAAADALAGLLLEKAEPRWSTLKPLAVKSEGGATLTVQPDASVLASGLNSDVDVYVIEAEVQGRIESIRLEAIPDPSMPAGGSGRAPGWGNFMLTDFRVMAGEGVVAWSRAYADFSQDTQWDKPKDFSIANAIDTDESTAWAIWPRVAEPHWAVFVPKGPIAAVGKLRLTIRLAFQSKENKGYTLGRFRLSVKEANLSWVTEAMPPHAKLGAACLALGDRRRAVELLTKAIAENPRLPAADWLVLALAHARLKETDQALKACAAAAALLQASGADPALRPLLREVVLAVGPDSPTATTLIAAAAGDSSPAALNEAIQYDREDVAALRDRGIWFAERTQWREAIADWTEAFRLDPDTLYGLRLGVLLAHTGDTDRYRAHCRVMLDKWADTENNFKVDQTLKLLLLRPDVKWDAQQLARLADVAVSGDKHADYFEYFMFAKGLHEYRTGRYADAIATCREIRHRAPKAQGDVEVLTGLTLIVEAMSVYRSGDKAGARRVLAEAKPHVDACVPGLGGADWTTDWVYTHMLYREADNLIAGKRDEQTK
jgi:formylglycine-generating enzyme required for sulfatase activity/tetratricopeptide (TPR) repeat protein/tRNA A-37 threonylcarbamoyl transferase component Bud32